MPEVAADSASWLWADNACNSSADKRDWDGLARRINVGTVGLVDRVARISGALLALGAS